MPLPRMIAICGFMGSGKDTVARHLIAAHGYNKVSFAGALKDAVAAIFGWPRDALEGETPESRVWRETVDPWWSERLQRPSLTPRMVLQVVGTDLFRNRFHDDIWIAAVERRLMVDPEQKVVITDCRFPNEMALIRRLGGVVWSVSRTASEPAWLPALMEVSKHSRAPELVMREHGAHPSEWLWYLHPRDGEIKNDGGLRELFESADALLTHQKGAEHSEGPRNLQ